MSEPCIKYEKDWTKIVITIVDEMFAWTTDTHSSDSVCQMQ